MPQPNGEKGDRSCSWSVSKDRLDYHTITDPFGFRDLLDEMELPGKIDILYSNGADGDGALGPGWFSLLVGHLDASSPSSSWAIFVDAVDDHDAYSDITLLEGSAQIQEFIDEKKSRLMDEYAGKILDLMREATGLDANQLLALKRSLRRQAGDVFAVWDSEEEQASLQRNTPSSPRRPGARRL